MVKDIISRLTGAGSRTINEYEAKAILAAYGVPVTREHLVTSRRELSAAVKDVGFPLVLKACSDAIAHKTEKNLVRLHIASLRAAERAYNELREAMAGAAGGILVQEMVPGGRELVAGMTRDGQFGPCVMFGLGGIFTEILRDVVFRKAPLTEAEAL
ncbi:MAG: acetate--CoA ligase family protein, partial [Syntrophales bacterium]|nr:acetate--CoA ligase family protein [Syntrophales bacterium]